MHGGFRNHPLALKSIPIFLLALLALVFPVFSHADEYEARTFAGADGTQLGYRLLKPKDFDAAKKYPLVLVLHGAGERGTDNAAQLKYGAPLFLKQEIRDKYPCFVAVPQCPPDQTWSCGEAAGPGRTPTRKTPTAPLKLLLGALDCSAQGISDRSGPSLRHGPVDGWVWHLGSAHARTGTLGGGGPDLRWRRCRAHCAGQGRGDLGVSWRARSDGARGAHTRNDRRARSGRRQAALQRVSLRETRFVEYGLCGARLVAVDVRAEGAAPRRGVGQSGQPLRINRRPISVPAPGRCSLVFGSARSGKAAKSSGRK